MKPPQLTFHPATPDRWADVEALFGPRGACAGCWCMFYRVPHAFQGADRNERNKKAFRAIVRRGDEPGLLAYADGVPVGWCAVAPRADYPRLARSRVLAPVDEAPVWSVPCFFVARGWRRKGLTARLLRAAATFAASRGAKRLEGYPIAPKKAKVAMADAFAWNGFVGAFERAGFKEVARRSPTRPVMRKALRGKRAK